MPHVTLVKMVAPHQTKEFTLRSFGTSLSAVLAGALGAAVLVAVAPTAQAEVGPAIRITEFSHSGMVARAGSGDGEFVELTNVGDAAADLTGWTYDNSTADAGSGLSLTPFGTVAPGESVLVTDLLAAAFRIEWGLKDSVKVLSNGKTHTLSAGPDAIHVYDDGGTEVDSVSYQVGFLPKGGSAAVDEAHLGATADTAGWSRASVNDIEGSWASGLGSIGSPGAATHGTLAPDAVRSVGGPEATCSTEDAGIGLGLLPSNPTRLSWPGGVAPEVVGTECAWLAGGIGHGLSGLAFDPNDADVLYAVKSTGHVFRLVRSDGSWVNDTANGWSNGKQLRFPGGTGLPDTEGITVGPGGALYITTERDSAAPGAPLNSVLRFDPTAAGTTLIATDQWELTADLGFTNADADLGFEGIAYVPDSFLTAAGFRTGDEEFYDPADYPGKVTAGIFLTAVEKTGQLRAYVLKSDHTYVRVADVLTGMAGVMDVSFDGDLGRIWTHCDNTCGNATMLMRVGVDGRIAYDSNYLRPAGLPNFNFEGFVVAPVSTASGGVREVLFADDGNRFGYSLWRGTINLDLRLKQVAQPLPIIGGTAIIGGTLTAYVGNWDPGVTVHYRWKVGGTVIATDTPLSLDDPALAGKKVILAVTGSRDLFADATMTATVAITDGSLATHVPKIGGTAAVGKTLTASVGAWGPAGVTLGYQWLSDGQPIAGATGTALRLTGALLGKTISFRVTGTKAGYAEESVESNLTAPVTVGTITTARPVIAGKLKVGKRLTARPGQWRADGTVVRYRYQWYVNGNAVRGATKAGFKVARACKGKRVTVKVTASAVYYAGASRTSAATSRVK